MHNHTIRVLMIGKSEKKMTPMAADMGDGFTVTFTSNLAEATDQLNGADYDVVVLSRALQDADRVRLAETLLAHNPQLAIVRSGGPHGRLVAMQVRAALVGHQTEGFILNGLHYTGGAVHFIVQEDTRVAVQVFRESMFFHLEDHTVFDGLLEAGPNAIAIPRKYRASIGVPFIFVTADYSEAHQVAGPFLT